MLDSRNLDNAFGIAKGFNKKRIDYRHHAMDAIIIASKQEYY